MTDGDGRIGHLFVFSIVMKKLLIIGVFAAFILSTVVAVTTFTRQTTRTSYAPRVALTKRCTQPRPKFPPKKTSETPDDEVCEDDASV